MKIVYIPETDTSFTHGKIYEAEEETDEFLGKGYAIFDDSEDWYWFSTEYVHSHFKLIDEQ